MQSLLTSSFIEATAALVVFWLLVYFLGRVLEPRYTKSVTIVAATGIFTVVLLIFVCLLWLQWGTIETNGIFLSNGYLFLTVVGLFLFIYTSLFQKGSFFQKLFWVLILYSFYLTSRVASDALMLAFFGTIHIEALSPIIHVLFCFITIVLMGNLLRPMTRKRMRSVWMSPKTMFFLALIPVLSCTVLLAVYYLLIIPLGQELPYALLLLTMALSIVVIMYCSFGLFKTQYYQARKEIRQEALIQQANLSKSS